MSAAEEQSSQYGCSGRREIGPLRLTPEPYQTKKKMPYFNLDLFSSNQQKTSDFFNRIERKPILQTNLPFWKSLAVMFP